MLTAEDATLLQNHLEEICHCAGHMLCIKLHKKQPLKGPYRRQKQQQEPLFLLNLSQEAIEFAGPCGDHSLNYDFSPVLS